MLIWKARFWLFCLVWTLGVNPCRAQVAEDPIDAAYALFQDNQPVTASEQLRSLLTSATADQMPPGKKAQAYIYLAMAELSLYRIAEAESALESALRSDSPGFVRYGNDWARDNRALVDSVAYRFLCSAQAFYEDAEYDQAVKELTASLPLEQAVSRGFAAQMHKTLAFCYIAMRKTNLARLEFRSALRLDRDLDLGDESVIAPKLRRAFLDVRRQTLAVDSGTMRRNTLVRSLIFPGWGQLYRGADLRGYGFMAAEIALLTGAFFSVRSFTSARSSYTGFGVDDAVAVYGRRGSVDDVTNELNARFSRYQTNGRRANLVLGLAAGVWLVNLADALILTLRKDGTYFISERPYRVSGVTMAWRPESGQWQVTYGLTW